MLGQAYEALARESTEQPQEYALHAIAQYAAVPHVPVAPRQQLAQKKAKLEALQLALSSDESVVLWELSLDVHTPCVKKKLLLES